MLDINETIICSSCFAEQITNSDICDVCGFDNSIAVENTGTLPMNMILMGRYIIGKALGRGGFGITYLAYDITNRQRVAIKEYFPDSLSYRIPGTAAVSSYSNEKEEIYKSGSEKFYAEAKTLSRFNGNAHIINVKEFFYENNTAYYVMEYVDGIDLKKYTIQNGGRLPYEKVMEILTPMLYALIIVHSMDVLHRDISPDNIYITKDGNVKLLDFGAARKIYGEQTNSLSVVLKQGFTPLEQYRRSGNHGPWSDIYSLGATIYYALTGIIPEESINRFESDDLKMPSELGIKVPPAFETILKKMLAIRPENRYQSATQLKEDLRKVQTEKLKPKQILTKDFFKKYKIPIAFLIGLMAIVSTFAIILSNSSNKISEKIVSIPTEEPEPSQSPIQNEMIYVKQKEYTYKTPIFSVIGKYDGEWQNEMPNGWGVLTLNEAVVGFCDEGATLSGQFKNGLLEGEGVLQLSDGTSFTGTFKNGVINGQGTYLYSNGDSLSAEFINNIANGQGTYIFQNGEIYEGQFSNGKPHGLGRYTYLNGDIYEGDYTNGNATGKATYIYADGGIITGDFVNGIPTGRGIYTALNGNVYSGEFKDGYWDGEGVLKDPSGNIIAGGFWLKGKFIGENPTNF